MIAMMMAAALTAQAPSAEAEVLGLEVARNGALASLLPLVEKKEVAEMIADHPGLTADEQAKLRATADRVYHEQAARVSAAIGHQYAATLGLADLRAIAAFNRSAAARHYRAAMPGVMAAAMKQLDGVDSKGETLKAFCAETGKACPTAGAAK